MILSTGRNVVHLVCDCCETEAEGGFESFAEARDWARGNGWVAIKDPDDGEWENHCPTCKKHLPLPVTEQFD